MTVGLLSQQQLRSIVEEKWKRDIDAVAVGLHVAPSWQGPSQVDFEFGPANVVRADTVFEIRQALRTAEKNKSRLVLLTSLQQAELGHDVVARLARSRLLDINHWSSLCSLFKAKELDRTVCEPAIAQVLMDYAPPDGYPPVSAGLLDAGTVWRAICRHVFDMGEREPDLVTLLLWASSKGVERYQKAGDEICACLRQRLVNNLGEAADSVLRFIESGAGPDTLALSVVCQVVFGEGDQTVLDAAAARMEQYHGNKPVSKNVGRTLAKTVIDAIADLDRHDDPRIAQQHLQRADVLLKQFLCDDHAYRNNLSLLAYEQRLGRLGIEIKQAIENKTDEAIAACEVRLADINQHRMAKLGRRKEQVSKAEMAVRLVRWLNQTGTVPPSVSEQANSHIRELSFVDWAREPLCRGGDETDLSTAYQLLDKTVLERRTEVSRVFATALADWTAVGSTAAGVIGVEDVLGNVVSKVIGAGNRVLLVVLDGMSWAVCHELLEDIRQDHWFESTLDESNIPPVPVIATIPSVTNYSRTSLLSGVLVKGDQNLEKKNFEANKALVECCDKRYPPILFHKKDITEGNRGVLAEVVRKKVLSNNHKLVGVVINAIDDRLSNAQQVIDHWSISRIDPMRKLLRLARDSGRVVILASDHGHVWHRPDGERRPYEESSRWRTNDGSCAEDEIVMQGERVMQNGGDKSVIVPWTEKVYYKMQHNGYHGGATPQEMICPLILLTDKSSAYSGLHRCEYPKPDWWSAAPVATPEVVEPQVTITVPSAPPTLFDMQPKQEKKPKPTKKAEPQEAGEVWIDQLIASAAYKDQKKLIRRHAPDDDSVRASLTALAASGGIMTPAAFANAANVPAARLDGMISKLQRMLNVDGYEILTLERNENRVEVNITKLKRQFDLD